MRVAPRRTTLGGQPRYFDLAIDAASTLNLAFGLRLRQAEALRKPVLSSMGLELALPDHTIAEPAGTDMAIAVPTA